MLKTRLYMVLYILNSGADKDQTWILPPLSMECYKPWWERGGDRLEFQGRHFFAATVAVHQKKTCCFGSEILRKSCWTSKARRSGGDIFLKNSLSLSRSQIDFPCKKKQGIFGQSLSLAFRWPLLRHGSVSARYHLTQRFVLGVTSPATDRSIGPYFMTVNITLLDPEEG